MNKIIIFIGVLTFSSLSFSFEKEIEKKCTMYHDNPTSQMKEAFPNCQWKPLYEFYSMEKSFLGPLEEGTHCSIEREKKVAKPDMFHCNTNSTGLPKQAFFNKLFLRCEEIGPSPDYPIYRTWFEEKDIFEKCVSV